MSTLPAERLAALNAAMDRYARGDDCAFLQVYQLLVPRMSALLLARGCSRALAEDLQQQAFLHMHRARERYKPGQDVVPWALSIVRRLFVDHWRRGQRECTGDLAEHDARECADPEQHSIALQSSQQLTLEISRLPAPQRLAFELVRLNGLSLGEAAAALGTTVTGVKLRLHRAHAALRQAIRCEIALE